MSIGKFSIFDLWVDTQVSSIDLSDLFWLMIVSLIYCNYLIILLRLLPSRILSNRFDNP